LHAYMHMHTCQIKQNVILFGQILNAKTSFFFSELLEKEHGPHVRRTNERLIRLKILSHDFHVSSENYFFINMKNISYDISLNIRCDKKTN
jgi:hypothetical protein